MFRRGIRSVVCTVVATFAVVSSATALRAQTPVPASAVVMSVAVDASHATQLILHVHEQIAVAPGSLTLEYPRWIPGNHSPTGPIVNVAGLTITAGLTPLRWLRDLVDLDRFHVEVPPGATSIDVRFDYLGAAPEGRSLRLASANMLALIWNEVVLAPAAADARTILITPSITLPGADWQYATALDTVTHAGAAVAFAPVTLDQLVDSPLDAGTNMRRWPLGSIDGAPVDIAVVADTPEELDADPVIAKLRVLVTQMGRLYRARHFNHYTFLLTVSDVLPGNGVEHHQSSDDGHDGNYLIDTSDFTDDIDLLPHEFNHSWDGKYRRPADLATPNLHVPMKDDLLWVYEGMTQFYGYLEATRAGLLTPAQYRDYLALTYAALDTTTGRAAQPLVDTAVAAPILYGSASAFHNQRRGVDFYNEGELMWLEADVLIRKRTSGKRSIDDFSRAFFGRTSTGPQVLTYTRDDIIAALNAVAPYDWAGFFHDRVDAIAPHPPDALTGAGWRVAFAAQPSALQKIWDGVTPGFDARYSLGIVGGDKHVISDVIDGSPAWHAGVTPGDTIVAVGDREISKSRSLQAQLDAALVAAQHGGPPVRLLLLGGGAYREVTIPYTGGPRYPVLEPIPGAPDLLDAISAPLGS